MVEPILRPKKGALPPKAIVVSFLNLKGGVGKTTLCLAIAEFLAHRHKKRVLLIDLDSQSNLTSAMVGDPSRFSRKTSIYYLFKELLEQRGIDPKWNLQTAAINPCGNVPSDLLSIVVALPELGQFDEDLADALEQSQKSGALKVDIGWRKVLSRKIEKVRDLYDYVLIDCPPSLSIFTSNALVASDWYVTPMAPEFLSIQGLDLIDSRMKALAAKSGLKGKLADFAGCILNRVDIRRRDHIEKASSVLNNRRFKAFENWVGDHKPMYLVTDFHYPDNVMHHPWPSLQKKYEFDNQTFVNPRKSRLEYKAEADEYTAFQRLEKLTNEFVSRCR